MRVSDSRRVLFVHVPKSGGSTLDALFDNQIEDARKVEGLARHSPLSRLLRAEPELEDYWSFGFVRNPWERMVSWWSMVAAVFERAESGVEQARRKIETHPRAWLPEGEFREHFDRDFNVVREKLGLQPITQAPRRNVSSHGHYSDYYNDKTRRKVSEVFARDIEAFGYTF